MASEYDSRASLPPLVRVQEDREELSDPAAQAAPLASTCSSIFDRHGWNQLRRANHHGLRRRQGQNWTRMEERSFFFPSSPPLPGEFMRGIFEPKHPRKVAGIRRPKPVRRRGHSPGSKSSSVVPEDGGGRADSTWNSAKGCPLARRRSRRWRFCRACTGNICVAELADEPRRCRKWIPRWFAWNTADDHRRLPIARTTHVAG